LHRHLQSQPDRAGWLIGRQFLRAATSIAANVEEARDGESRADFIHKYAIAQKEARECRYWLRLLTLSGIVQEEATAPLLDECGQLYAIITAIITRAKGNS
jgi:four helix bundle protein